MRETTRRAFLHRSGRGVLGSALFWPRSLSAQLTGDSGWTALIAGIEAQIPPLMTALHVPGVSLVLIRDGVVAWQRGFGVTDASTNRSVAAETIFEAASMSKPVFAYAVLKLCEKKVLALDTPLVTYGAPPILEGDPRIKLITARHVLSHSTGFQNWRTESEPLRIHFTPGTQYRYSGEGFAWLQSVVNHVTKQPIEPFMKANLLEPFGMTTSGYIWNETFATRAARPHDATGRPEDNRKRSAADVARYAAAGDLETTPTEYAKFLLEVIAPKPPDEYRLTAATLKEMCRPQVKEPNAWGARGLGWELVHMDKGDVIQHGGDNPGFHAFAVASVQRRFGAVVMTNGESGATLIGRFLSDVIDRLHVVSRHSSRRLPRVGAATSRVRCTDQPVAEIVPRSQPQFFARVFNNLQRRVLSSARVIIRFARCVDVSKGDRSNGSFSSSSLAIFSCRVGRSSAHFFERNLYTRIARLRWAVVRSCVAQH